MQDDAGVEAADPRAHDQPVESREAHGGGDAAAAADRAHAGAVAEMGDDQALGQAPVREVAQALRYILVGQAVEAIAQETLLLILAGQREAARLGWLGGMEGGVE